MNRRALLCALVTVSLLTVAGCANGPTEQDPELVSSNDEVDEDDLEMITIERNGTTYNCIYLEDEHSVRGTGGLWCERANRSSR